MYFSLLSDSHWDSGCFDILYVKIGEYTFALDIFKVPWRMSDHTLEKKSGRAHAAETRAAVNFWTFFFQDVILICFKPILSIDNDNKG